MISYYFRVFRSKMYYFIFLSLFFWKESSNSEVEESITHELSRPTEKAITHELSRSTAAAITHGSLRSHGTLALDCIPSCCCKSIFRLAETAFRLFTLFCLFDYVYIIIFIVSFEVFQILIQPKLVTFSQRFSWLFFLF